MARTAKELKGVLGKLTSAANRLEEAGLQEQAMELDGAYEAVEKVIDVLKAVKRL
jgi:hypothetical protein